MNDPDIDIPPYASSRRRSRGLDRETRTMAIIAGSLGVGIIALALLWSGIHTGLGPPPLIKPPPGPMRTVPTNPGGLQVPGAHEQIMSGDVASGPPQLAPASPKADFSTLDREAAASRPTAPKIATAIAPSSDALPLPPPQQPSQPDALAPLPPAALAALPPMHSPTPATTAGPYAVQLAALNSEQKADQAWQTLVARIPDILSARKPVVVPGVIHGATFYRLRLGGFPTSIAAADFCSRLKSRGITCYIPK